MSHQERIHQFLIDRDLLDLDGQIEKLGEERQEFWEAMAVLQTDDSDEALKQAAIEAVDTIIVTTGIVSILGFNVDELVRHKLDINDLKYSLDSFNDLLDQGKTPVEARQELKDFWNELEMMRMGRF